MAIDPNLLEIIQQEATKAAKAVYADKGTMFGVADTPTHSHNNVDSTQLPFLNTIPSVGSGVLSPTQLIGVGNGSSSQVQSVFFANTSTPSINNLLSLAVPIIGGFGTTSPLTTTTAPLAGAVSATLTGNFGGTTSIINTLFGDGEMRKVQYTAGSTAITWSGGLTFNTLSTTITLTAASRFQGGDAPLGTLIIFTNPDDGLKQLWFRADVEGDLVNQWFGFDFTVTAP